MHFVRDVLQGIGLTAALWWVLEASAVYWFDRTTSALGEGVVVPAVALILVGAVVVALALLPVSPWTTAMPALLLALIAGSVLIRGDSLPWLGAMPGSPLRLASFVGTYVVIGALASVTVIRGRASRRGAGGR
jgi:hypothetical protein